MFDVFCLRSRTRGVVIGGAVFWWHCVGRVRGGIGERAFDAGGNVDVKTWLVLAKSDFVSARCLGFDMLFLRSCAWRHVFEIWGRRGCS